SFGANLNARALKIPGEQRRGYRQSLKELSLRSFIAANYDAITFSQPQALGRVHNPTLLIAGENEHPLIHSSMAVMKKTLPNAQERWAQGCGPRLVRRKARTLCGDGAGMVPGTAAPATAYD